MATATSSTTTSVRSGGIRSAAGHWLPLVTAAVLTVACGVADRVFAGAPPHSEATRDASAPRIQPDYQGLVIPPNIAPLNFRIREPAASFQVRLSGKAGNPIEIRSRGSEITIPEKPWRQLLDRNRGGELRIEIQARDGAGPWRRYVPLTNRVAAEGIDPVLIYRKIHPAHNSWSTMGIYQRRLDTYDETPVLENHRFASDCCHCHTLRNNDPDTLTMDIRSSHYENSLLIVSNGVVETLRGNVGFVAWHPQKSLLAASFSKPRLMLHSARNDMRDIAELESWIGYLPNGSDEVRKVPGLSDDTRLTGFPAWSPDGLWLYYCSAPNPWTNMAALTATSHATARYDLMRLSYDPDGDRWGVPEAVLLARDTGFSVAQPRISPDGRWLFFCAVEYGCWPTYDAKSDLWGIDLEAFQKSGQPHPRRLELNSEECESWLSWSSNSRWVVFSSKRLSPLFNRPYLAYVAPSGECGKPFVVPQADPAHYDSLLKTFTIPTLATGPVRVSQRKLAEAIRNPARRSLAIPKPVAPADPNDHP